MATTPPPPSPSVLRIPPAPRHGAGYDKYEPYPTRYSTRLASQRSSRESRTTPPPGNPATSAKSGVKSAKKQSNEELVALSPPGSVFSSPRKKPSSHTMALAPTHSLGGPSISDTSNPFNATETSHAQHHPPKTNRPTLTDGMLPTPAKTPRKKAVGDVAGAACTLFPSAHPKKTKKHTGYSLDSFVDNATQKTSQIEIYTDSRDRIPEVDESEGNPFYKKHTQNELRSQMTPRASRRSKREEMKRDKEVNEAVKREDGMFYIFRGKKIFRKFSDNIESDGEDENDLGLLAARPDLIDSSITTAVRPLTRSSIKPRVLFPSANERSHLAHQISDADEEAATDIDDDVLKDLVDDSDHATDVEMPQPPVTPPLKSTVATPPSPGATSRSLRSRSKRASTEHTESPTGSESKTKGVSPFAGWLRKKQTPAAAGSKAKKRVVDTVSSPGGPATKKTRGNRVTSAP